MGSNGFLEAISVTKNYAGGMASGVNNVSLSIKPGKITAIVGESGSGKSTLLKLFYGLLDPDQGEVRFKGNIVMGPAEKLIPGHDRMKMVTQHTDDLNLFATVSQNIAALLPNTNLAYKRGETERLLHQLNIFALRDKRVFDLSGGEKQRAAIAKALITKPEVLFLDEPFNQVDASFREGLQQNIRQIVAETGLTVVMVSHDPAEVLSMADMLIVFRSGGIVEQGEPKALYRTPETLYTARLLSHCAVLTKAQAAVCGIVPESDFIAVYSEDVNVRQDDTGGWLIKQIMFKGFFEELVLYKDGIELRAIHTKAGWYHEGQRVGVGISKYLEYSCK